MPSNIFRKYVCANWCFTIDLVTWLNHKLAGLSVIHIATVLLLGCGGQMLALDINLPKTDKNEKLGTVAQVCIFN